MTYKTYDPKSYFVDTLKYKESANVNFISLLLNILFVQYFKNCSLNYNYYRSKRYSYKKSMLGVIS